MSDDCDSGNENKVALGFILSTAAGLMTFIGALSVFIPIPREMMRLSSCFCLAAASGVMTYVSLVEVLHESMAKFEEGYELSAHENVDDNGAEMKKGLKPGQMAMIMASLTFFAGWFIALLMDKALHHYLDYHGDGLSDVELPLNNTTPVRLCDEERQAQIRFDADTHRLVGVGWFTALALTLHNIPEGLLTYVAAQADEVGVGFGIACAIGLHNIPEGFAVAMPIFIGTKSRSKAMFFAGITGFAEPLGALIGYAIFSSGEGRDTSTAESLKAFGVLFGITAGIMTEVAIKSLLLEAVRYDPTDRIVSTAWILGALVIAASLIVINVTTPDACPLPSLTNSTLVLPV